MIGDASVELGRYQQGFDAFARLGELRPGLVAYARLSYSRELVRATSRAPRGSCARPSTRARARPRTRSGHACSLRRCCSSRATSRRPPGSTATRSRCFPATRAPRPAWAPSRSPAATSQRPRSGTTAQPRTCRCPTSSRSSETCARRAAMRPARRRPTPSSASSRRSSSAPAATPISRRRSSRRPTRARGRGLSVVALARKALAFRPSIYGHDSLAWALYSAGKCRQALPQAMLANRLGTIDPELSWHLGAIAACAGKRGVARAALAKALARTPHFHPLDAPAAQRLLRSSDESPDARCGQVALAASATWRAPPPRRRGRRAGRAGTGRPRRIRSATSRSTSTRASTSARTDVSVRYVLDMAEIPTFQRRQTVDANGDGRIGRGEGARARSARRDRCRRICGSLADGEPVQLALETARVAFPKGQGGLSTTRLDARFRAPGLELGGRRTR